MNLFCVKIVPTKLMCYLDNVEPVEPLGFSDILYSSAILEKSMGIVAKNRAYI